MCPKYDWFTCVFPLPHQSPPEQDWWHSWESSAPSYSPGTAQRWAALSGCSCPTHQVAAQSHCPEIHPDPGKLKISYILENKMALQYYFLFQVAQQYKTHSIL